MVIPNDLKVASITPFGLRIQPALKAQLEEAARKNGNSLNTEIAMRLSASIEADKTSSNTDAQVRALRNEVDDLRDEVKGLRGTVNMLMGDGAR